MFCYDLGHNFTTQFTKKRKIISHHTKKVGYYNLFNLVCSNKKLSRLSCWAEHIPNLGNCPTYTSSS
jgi:hypothetical protein